MDTKLTLEQQELLAQCELDFVDRYTESDPDYAKVLTTALPPIVHPWDRHVCPNYSWGASPRRDQGGWCRWKVKYSPRDDRHHNRYQPYHRTVEPTKMKYKILIAHSEIPKTALTMFDHDYELIFSEGSPYSSRETLLKNIHGVDAALWFGHIHVDEEMINAAGSQLKVVGVMSAGYDHIDVKLLKERNIKVSNAPNVLSSAVADMSVALALAVSRNLLQGNKAILANEWVVNHPTWMWGPTLEGATVGIVGMGGIGCKIAQRIKSFDIGKLLYHNRSPRPEAAALGAELVSLDDLLSKSDFVFIIVPLGPETKHLFNMDKFKKMKPTSILINTSRGDVINQEDLVEALRTKLIWGAGLDVMTPEPLPHDHPLTTLPNVVLSPHISSATWKAREAMALLAATNIWNALNNKELLTPLY